ncbi:hypothetical protein [Rudanella lutea]|uniref:hypothetical protein n=1 Tax=Rudanella lutea TaxID=451374 RepID=UPI00037E7F31|nr:hypothetical protein [Rudanella lutea]
MSLCKDLPEPLHLMVMKVQQDATIAVAATAPHTRDLIRKVGRPTAMKLVCAVLKMASLSMNLSQPITPYQVFELAQLFLDKYPTDSVMDLIMCLKLLKSGSLCNEDGEVVRVYNRFDVQTVMEWMAAYGLQKAQWLEEQHRREAGAHKEAAKGLFLNADQLTDEAREVVEAVKAKLIRPTPPLETFTDVDYFATLEAQLPRMPEAPMRALLAEARRKGDRIVEQMVEDEIQSRRTTYSEVAPL